jgi:hypothetical protein
MALQYGVNITASDMRSILEKNQKQQSGVRTWRQLLGNASLGYQSQLDKNKSYYNDAMLQAYKSNFAQNNNIIGAGINAGGTKNLMADNRLELQNIYENYVKNYLSAGQSASEDYSDEVSAIQEGLTERAEKYSSLYNSAYKYLSEELYNASLTNLGEPTYDKDGNVTYDNPINTSYLEDRGMDWMLERDADGNILGLSSWDKILSKLKNSDGSLNENGTKFFDQLFNANPNEYINNLTGEDSKTFGQWLSDTDNELYNWLASKDLFNYNFADTNFGSAKNILGMESTDSTAGSKEYINTEDLNNFDKAIQMSGGAGNNNIFYKIAIEKSNQSFEVAKNTAAYLEEIEKQWRHRYGKYGDEIEHTLKNTALAKKTEAEAISTNAWNEYKKYTNTIKSTLDTKFKDLVNTNVYNKFYAQNKKIYDEYDKLLTQLNDSKTYDEDIAKKIGSIYSEMIRKMTAFLETSNYQKNLSGF